MTLVTSHPAPSSGQQVNVSSTLVYYQIPAELQTFPSASLALLHEIHISDDWILGLKKMLNFSWIMRTVNILFLHLEKKCQSLARLGPAALHLCT